MGDKDKDKEKEKEKEIKLKGRRNGEKAPTWEELSELFHLPVEAAAKELGIGLTPMKAICRELGLRRWPYRRIKSLQNLIRYYEDRDQEGSMEKDEAWFHVIRLKRDIQSIKKNPNFELPTDLKKTKQKVYKEAYKKKTRAAQIIAELAAF